MTPTNFPTPILVSREPWEEVVRAKVSRLHFGAVQITVHEGRVTQVECIERTRIPSPRDEARDE